LPPILCSRRPTMEHSSRFPVAHANHPKQKFCQCARLPVRTSAREQFYIFRSRKWIKSVRPHDAGKAAQHRIQFSESASDRRYKEQQTESVEQTAIDREMGEGRREVRRKLNKHLHDNTLLSAPSSAELQEQPTNTPFRRLEPGETYITTGPTIRIDFPKRGSVMYSSSKKCVNMFYTTRSPDSSVGSLTRPQVHKSPVPGRPGD